MSLLDLFCHVDDSRDQFKPYWDRLLGQGLRKRLRMSLLSDSEIMTIMVHFHQSHYRDFKAYYTEYVGKHLRSEFPYLVSYTWNGHKCAFGDNHCRAVWACCL